MSDLYHEFRVNGIGLLGWTLGLRVNLSFVYIRTFLDQVSRYHISETPNVVCCSSVFFFSGMKVFLIP